MGLANKVCMDPSNCCPSPYRGLPFWKSGSGKVGVGRTPMLGGYRWRNAPLFGVKLRLLNPCKGLSLPFEDFL